MEGDEPTKVSRGAGDHVRLMRTGAVVWCRYVIVHFVIYFVSQYFYGVCVCALLLLLA